MLAVAVIMVAVVAFLATPASVRILKQYERGVQFRLGRVKDGARGPGLIVITPFVDRVHRVSLELTAFLRRESAASTGVGEASAQTNGVVRQPEVTAG